MRERVDRASDRASGPFRFTEARGRRGGWLLICAFLLLGLCASGPPAAASPLIARCELEGVVDAGSGAYLADCVKRSEEKGAQALLVRLDTPGGSLEATRAIVRAFLGSRVPVLVWVGPSGARAGSAGVFIALASNVSAMAPGDTARKAERG